MLEWNSTISLCEQEEIMAKGILAVGFDYTNAHEDEFHDWYDLEHIP